LRSLVHRILESQNRRRFPPESDGERIKVSSHEEKGGQVR
jgi:hypothetical protein